MFHPVRIGEGAHAWSSIDATVRHANPIQELLRQAQDHFGRDEQVATVLSVGTGKIGLNSLEEGYSVNGSFEDVLRRVAEGCEEKHQEMHSRLKDTGVYFRLNVEHGLKQGLHLSEQSNPMIKAHTDTYLQGEAISDLVDELVKSLLLRTCQVTLKQMSKYQISTKSSRLQRY